MSNYSIQVRAEAGNAKAIQHYFEHIVHKHVYERLDLPDGRIPSEWIYAADESMVLMSHQHRRRIIGRREAKMAYQQGGEDKEHITVLPCICADGTYLAPFIIFKGKTINPQWRAGNSIKAAFGVSDNGWIDNEHALWWLQHHFDPLTKGKANGRPRVLFLDGHGSHLSVLFIQYARDANIIILCYPPHTTHLLQGLDVVCFAKFKQVYAKHVKLFETEHPHLKGLRKVDFTSVCGTAMIEAFSPATVAAAFSATGIDPYNPNVIDPVKLKPSEATSINANFTTVQPLAVRHIVAAFTTQLNVERHARALSAEATSIPIDPVLLEEQPVHDLTPHTPNRPRIHTSADFTIRSRWRHAREALTAETSTSILLSEECITSTQVNVLNPPATIEQVPTLFNPNWKLLDKPNATREELRAALAAAKDYVASQRTINEFAGATMVVQNLIITKQNVALFGREESKKKKKSHFPSGLGRAITDDAMLEGLQQAERTKEATEREKAARESARARKKELVAAIESEWKVLTDAHKIERHAWELDCATRLAQGIRKSQLPKAPARPVKKRLAETLTSRADMQTGAENGQVVAGIRNERTGDASDTSEDEAAGSTDNDDF